MVEHLTFNQGVVGSSPTRLTILWTTYGPASASHDLLIGRSVRTSRLSTTAGEGNGMTSNVSGCRKRRARRWRWAASARSATARRHLRARVISRRRAGRARTRTRDAQLATPDRGPEHWRPGFERQLQDLGWGGGSTGTRAYDLQHLTQYDERGWRATFYTTEHGAFSHERHRVGVRGHALAGRCSGGRAHDAGAGG